MSNLKFLPLMVERECSKCTRTFRCTLKSKQEFCCKFCEFSWVKASGDKKKMLDMRKELSQVLTIPKDTMLLRELNFRARVKF